MSVTVTFDFPPEIERKIADDLKRLTADAREAMAVQLFRRGEINHFQLASILSLDRFATDAILKRYNVDEQSLSDADLEADRQTLDRVLGKGNDAGGSR